MFHASESTGLLDCCGKFWLRSERLLRGLVRRHSPDRVVSGYGRDDDVALEDLAISRVVTVCSLLLRWRRLTHDGSSLCQCMVVRGGIVSTSQT